MLTINGAPAFPIGLSDPPGIGALAPGGQTGLDVVASAGVRVFRVVPPDGSWGAGDNTVLSEVQYAHQWDVAAAKRSALTMVWLARLAQATPGTVYDQTLRQVVTSLAPDAGLGFWKGSDGPFHHGRSASSLAYAYQTTHDLDPAHLTFLIEAARERPLNWRPTAPSPTCMALTSTRSASAIHAPRWLRSGTGQR